MTRALLAIAGIATLAAAQPPAFDVAAVKKIDPSASSTACCAQIAVAANGRRVRIDGITIRVLIQRAYNVFPSQLSGGPSWINSESYAIAAKAEDGPPLSSSQFGPMLQRLLADRFALKLHRETKESQVLALLAGKNGPKLKEAGSEALNLSTSRGQVQATKVPMWMFAISLGHYMGQPVIDETGLKGNYDFTMTWTPGETEPAPAASENAVAADPRGASLFTALQEQLGLKLELKKGPLEVLVIDHVEKPSEN